MEPSTVIVIIRLSPVVVGSGTLHRQFPALCGGAPAPYSVSSRKYP